MKIRTTVFISIISIAIIFSITCSTDTKKVKDIEKTNTSETVNSSSNDKEEIDNTKNEENKTEVKTAKSFEGNYKIYLGKFEGLLQIKFLANKVYSGSIQFTNWGTGKPQPIKKLRINGRDLYFIRSITTPNERKLYGAKSNFTHIYRGKFSKDGSSIIGRYQYRGGIFNWRAKKSLIKN